MLYQDESCQYFQYANGNDASIICFNYSLPYGRFLHETLLTRNFCSSLFSINTYLEFDYKYIIDDLLKTKRLVLIDDSKSKNRLSNKFLNHVYSECKLDQNIVLDREYSEDLFFPRHDELEINYMAVAEKLDDHKQKNKV